MARATMSWPAAAALMRLKAESLPPLTRPTTFITASGTMSEGCNLDGHR